MSLFRSRRPKVPKLQRKRDLDGLCRALRYRETVVDDEGEWDLGVQVRVDAAEALGDFDGPAVADDLAEGLDDSQPAVRLACIETLSKLGVTVGVEKLADLVAARDEDAEGVSDRALALLEAWRLEGPADRVAERLLQPVGPPLDDRHRDAVDRLLVADPAEAATRDAIADRVVASLRDAPEDVSDSRAERVLGWLGASGVDALIVALEDGSAVPALVRAAGFAGDARAVDAVIAALGSPEPEMRRAGAMAGGALNHTQVVPQLLGATQDPDQSVRDAASAALNRIGMAAVIVGLSSLMGPGSSRQLGPGDAHVGSDDGERLPREAPDRLADAAPTAPGLGAPTAATRRRGGIVDRLLGRIA